jgi:exodeoxyribonuclease V gamma subunit
VRWRDAPLRAADHVEAWLLHLALCAAAPAGVALRTRWLARDAELAFVPCADARSRLAELLALYRRGLCEPLRFFPRSAREYMASGLPGARRAWHATPHQPFAEGADAAYRLALRGIDDPLDAEFEALAHAVFTPLLAHLQDAPQ